MKRRIFEVLAQLTTTEPQKSIVYKRLVFVKNVKTMRSEMDDKNRQQNVNLKKKFF